VQLSTSDGHPAFAPAIAAICLAGAIAAMLLPSYYVGLLIEGLIFAIFATSLNLILGFAGLPSLGHAAYFAAGAYATGLVAVHLTQSFWIGMLAGTGTGALLGALFGLLALRATGAYFLMITLALAQIAWAVAFSWRTVTGGDDGLRGIGRPQLWPDGLELGTTLSFYLLTLAAFGAVIVFVRALLQSPFGLTLRGLQTSPRRMEALGYHVWLHKYIAFVLSSGLSGFAGVLFVYYKGFISPEAASIVVSAEVMLMVILGGAGTLFGPAVGAFAIILLSNVVSAHTARWTFVLGALYVIVVLIAPDGVVGARNERSHDRQSRNPLRRRSCRQ
jgi:branched-chain amino acid transport system permease protein